MVRETRLRKDCLIAPLFVREGQTIKEEIASMPGQFRYSIDRLGEEIEQIRELGIPAVLLFGIPNPESKDRHGSAAFDEAGIVCRALRKSKPNFPDVLFIADVCLCEYTDHGHCGLVGQGSDGRPRIENDPSLEALSRTAIAYARAGADVIAPSDMMDGRVAAIRKALDAEGRWEVPILSYASKYASAYYGPFREAAESAPLFGDRRSYQMDPANAREALKEVRLDLNEGADMVMVKPALPCLDVIRLVKDACQVPVAAYQVSGEYAALCAAFERGWLDRDSVILETLLSIRRAGADLIASYFAKEAARLLDRGPSGRSTRNQGTKS